MAENALLKARNRILGLLKRKTEPEEKEAREDSLSGIAVAAALLDNLEQAFKRPSSELEDIYDDMREMDDSVDEVSVGLDHLSEDSMLPDPNLPTPFRVVFEQEDSRAEELVGNLFARLLPAINLVELAREALLMGNDFRQIGVSAEPNVVGLMYLPTETMRVQTDEQARLLPGGEDPEQAEGWPYIQVINEAFRAGFYPWEVTHTKWGTRGGSLYGHPLYSTSRWAWRKLVAMEDALVLNWLTRAFARLLFVIDVTGKSDVEADKYIRRFQQNLRTMHVGADKTSQSQLSLIRDIFLGVGYHELGGSVHEGLTDVKVLDTSGTAFANIDPVEYYRGKIIMSGRVPRAYLGLEEDINAKATLAMEDRKYAKTLATIQSVIGRTLMKVIDLEMILSDMVPMEHRYAVLWYNPSRADVVDQSLAQAQFADADERFLKMGVVDLEYVATKHIGMSPAEWSRVAARVQSQAQTKAQPEPEQPKETDK